jgi:hypothetical protein
MAKLWLSSNFVKKMWKRKNKSVDDLEKLNVKLTIVFFIIEFQFLSSDWLNSCSSNDHQNKITLVKYISKKWLSPNQ